MGNLRALLLFLLSSSAGYAQCALHAQFEELQAGNFGTQDVTADNSRNIRTLEVKCRTDGFIKVKAVLSGPFFFADENMQKELEFTVHSDDPFPKHLHIVFLEPEPGYALGGIKFSAPQLNLDVPNPVPLTGEAK